MSDEIKIGTAKAVPGTIQYGQISALDHPTGHEEFFPVIIAQGEQPGPCIWLTSGIHGPEHSGPLVLYSLLTPALLTGLLFRSGLRVGAHVWTDDPRSGLSVAEIADAR